MHLLARLLEWLKARLSSQRPSPSRQRPKLPRREEPLSFLERFLELMAAFQEQEVDYILVGGVAMNVLGFSRSTEDIDVFVAPTRENIDRLKRALLEVWPDRAIEEIQADDLLGEYPVVRYGPPEEDVYVDLMTRLGESLRYEDLDARVIEISGVRVRVATPRTLYNMKHDTLRPIDQFDASRLLEILEDPKDSRDS